MSPKKRKPVAYTIESVLDAKARDLAPERAVFERRYPRAQELADSPQWKDWLTGALRTLLAPTLLATAVATSGCDASETFSDVLSPPEPVRDTGPAVQMEALPPEKVPDSTNQTPCPIPPPGTIPVPVHPNGPSVMGQMRVVDPMPVRPPPAGTGMRQRTVPLPQPLQMPGGMGRVHPPAPPPAPSPTAVTAPKPPTLPAVNPAQIDGGLAHVGF